MANNKLSDLNDHLFAQLERLNDETISPEEMKLEIQKAKAVSSISAQITKTAAITLQAAKFIKNEMIPSDNIEALKTKLIG